MDNPDRIAPLQNRGEMVLWYPGMTARAKSQETMLWTEITSGVARPARRR